MQLNARITLSKYPFRWSISFVGSSLLGNCWAEVQNSYPPSPYRLYDVRSLLITGFTMSGRSRFKRCFFHQSCVVRTAALEHLSSS